MGLFWSLQLAPGQRKAIWLKKGDVTTPYTVHLSVLSDEGEVLASESCERWFLAPSVKRISVRHGRLRGTMFIPEGIKISIDINIIISLDFYLGEGPFPGVIDLYGTGGGLNECRAALLASKGFVTFALAFFNHEDLPKGIELEMEYFEVVYKCNVY